MPERPDSFAQRQLDDVDGLVALIAARICEQVSTAGELSPELRIELVGRLRKMATAGLELVIKGESFDALGPMIEEMARRRRAQGIERPQTLRVYEVAQQALLDSLSRQLRGHPQEADLFPLVTRRLLEFQRVTTFWVTAGYSSSPEPRGRDRAADVQVLLEIRAGRRSTDSEDRNLARRLGLSQPLKEVTVSAELGVDLEDTVRNTARVNPWGVVGALDGRVVALTLRSPHAFPEPRGIATLPDVADPPTVEAAIEAAGRAADVAAALGTGHFAAGQAAPLSALLAVPPEDRDAYVEGCFRALPQTARGRALLNAVAATLTYGRSGEAARALHVHRHTLDYRLSRFATETGLDLGDPATRFRCMIGLFLLGLMPHRPEPAELSRPS
jgi:PucR C-terminal helix-turn-helix domain